MVLRFFEKEPQMLTQQQMPNDAFQQMDGRTKQSILIGQFIHECEFRFSDILNESSA
jgi:hypothetical protein